MDKKDWEYLKELNERFNDDGFSWQHDDYFQLSRLLPEIIVVVRELENQIVLVNTVLDATMRALMGEEVSDFEMSFNIVRIAADTAMSSKPNIIVEP